MHSTVVLLPNALGEDSGFRQALPSLAQLTELGALCRIAPVPEVETPEALWLGMPPREAQMAQGPLTVAALGADPPPRSTHFHLSLLGLVDERIVQPPSVVPPEDLRLVLEQAKRLNTRTLTLVEGEGLDHALVWEDLGELRTTPAGQAIGASYRTVWPEGDGEVLLRRFIDDSVNLLSELELNARRIDEGIAPINLLWPWGHGQRSPVPNLALRRGEVIAVESTSMRLAGLSRLAGYRHGDRASLGRGTNTRFETVAERLKAGSGLAVLEAFEQLLWAGRQEEVNWLMAEMDRRLIRPLLDGSLRTKLRLTLIATGDSGGLAVSLHAGRNSQQRSNDGPGSNVYPFDERSIDERALPVRDLWQVVDEAFTPT